MRILDDANNRRIRQLIEQFNAEEAYDFEVRFALEELRKLLASDAALPELVAAIRKARRKLPAPPSVNAIGISVETSSQSR